VEKPCQTFRWRPEIHPQDAIATSQGFDGQRVQGRPRRIPGKRAFHQVSFWFNLSNDRHRQADQQRKCDTVLARCCPRQVDYYIT
jgi:hypothetical protein